MNPTEDIWIFRSIRQLAIGEGHGNEDFLMRLRNNLRQSAIQGAMKRIKAKEIEVVYELALTEGTFINSRVVNDFNLFKEISDVIVVNRLSSDLHDVRAKVYTRDLFSRADKIMGSNKSSWTLALFVHLYWR